MTETGKQANDVVDKLIEKLFKKYDADKNKIIDKVEKEKMVIDLSIAYMDLMLSHDIVQQQAKNWTPEHLQKVRSDNETALQQRINDLFEDLNRDGKLDVHEIKEGMFKLWSDFTVDLGRVQKQGANVIENGLV